jgi:superoxide dismutase, Cu-Zn family
MTRLDMTITQALLTTALMATALTAKDLTVKLADGQGQPIGTAKISDNKDGGVSINLDVKNLVPGEHALHFHGTAKCEGPGFTTSGGHFNPAMKQHGQDNPMGSHAGDMANFTVGTKGTAKVTIVNPAVTLGDGASSLFANGGTALMIHAKADDYKSDPAGNAGDRIACGVVTK